MDIPTDWTPIGVYAQEMTATERMAKRMREQGMTDGEICRELCIRRDHLRDIVYEINRKEAIMARIERENEEEKAMRGKRTTDEQRAEVMELTRRGLTQKQIEGITGLSVLTVGRVQAAERMRAELAQTGEKVQAAPENAAVSAAEAPCEAVNHPVHYQGRYECIDEMRALFGREAVKAFCKCNAYKYRFRAARKGGDEDIRKAEWYMDYLMTMEREEQEASRT